MKTALKIIMACFLLVGTASCRYDQHCHMRIKGNGQYTEREYNNGYFNKIKVYETIRVHFIVGDTHSVKIKAESNVIDHIEVKVSAGLLRIKSEEGSCINAKHIDVYITAPNIQEFENDGTTYVDGTIRSENLSIVTNGTTDMHLAGHINKLSLVVNGTCDFDLYEAQVAQAYVKCNGTTRGKIKASEKLDVIINGTATIRYRGNPLITQDINGTGKMINDN